MTSNRAAGYTAAGKAKVFDPLNQGDKGAAKPLEKKTELSPEEKLREMEKEIHRLVEESAITRERGNLSLRSTALVSFYYVLSCGPLWAVGVQDRVMQPPSSQALHVL